MFENLVRVGNNSEKEGEDPEERSKRKRGAILKADMENLGMNEDLSTYDFAKLSC